MKSLAQIRAANALAASKYPAIGRGKKDGDVLSGFPQIVLNNGLLAAAASALELKKEALRNVGEFAVIYALARHLASDGVNIYQPAEELMEPPADDRIWLQYRTQIGTFVSFLADGDSSLLRRATAESLAYLAYLKRFVA